MGMKVSCLQDNLARGLNIVSRAVGTRSTLPVLSNVLLATDNGRLRLSATNLDLGITAWTHRPLDTMVLPLAYIADDKGVPVPWNETRWTDEEFTKLLRQAEGTLDIEARREIMCQIEDIMQNRGPIGNSYWKGVWDITRAEFQNIEAHPTNYDLLYNVWKDA